MPAAKSSSRPPTTKKRQRSPHEIHVVQLCAALEDTINKSRKIRNDDILDKYRKKWRWAMPGIALWISISSVVLSHFSMGAELDDEDAQEAEGDSEEGRSSSPAPAVAVQDEALFEQLMTLNPYPEFPLEKTLSMIHKKSPLALKTLVDDIFKVQARSGRGDDIRRIRKVLPEMLPLKKTDHLEQRFTGEGVKSERGWHNLDCASMLVPLKHRALFLKDREAFMKRVIEGEDDQYRFKASDYPSFLWANNTEYKGPQKMLKGMFLGHVVIRGTRGLYFGIASMYGGANSKARNPIAGIHGLTSLGPHHIGYSCVVIYNSASSLLSWSPRDKTFSLRKFYKNIVDLLSSNTPWAKKTLADINKQMPWDRIRKDEEDFDSSEDDSPEAPHNLLANYNPDDDSDAEDPPTSPKPASGSSVPTSSPATSPKRDRSPSRPAESPEKPEAEPLEDEGEVPMEEEDDFDIYAEPVGHPKGRKDKLATRILSDEEDPEDEEDEIKRFFEGDEKSGMADDDTFKTPASKVGKPKRTHRDTPHPDDDDDNDDDNDTGVRRKRIRPGAPSTTRKAPPKTPKNKGTLPAGTSIRTTRSTARRGG
ncbi:hypothetical protein D9611_013584 [Ephemerocybe angulata]|uniref:Uncharacterized protein n=1 Tax=Ephemerocybe angulata TaxID=980116 RepID=A0A8H5ARX2_9AGAR|nr:hypothetical protein D9611_013584 [Tulosesus angulatus]